MPIQLFQRDPLMSHPGKRQRNYCIRLGNRYFVTTKSEQRRITSKSTHAKVVELHPEDSSRGKKKGKTVTEAIASSLSEGVESVYEQTEMPVKPALFVVPDWDEFIEDNW